LNQRRSFYYLLRIQDKIRLFGEVYGCQTHEIDFEDFGGLSTSSKSPIKIRTIRFTPFFLKCADGNILRKFLPLYVSYFSCCLFLTSIIQYCTRRHSQPLDEKIQVITILQFQTHLNLKTPSIAVQQTLKSKAFSKPSTAYAKPIGRQKKYMMQSKNLVACCCRSMQMKKDILLTVRLIMNVSLRIFFLAEPQLRHCFVSSSVTCETNDDQ